MRELRPAIVELIRTMVGRTDAQLMAYAVMPNHLHVLLCQGRSALPAVMQPLLRRVVYRVQKHHGLAGTVVERRYRDRPCSTADHVREAVMYIHLNPWRAGLCDARLRYPWTSHEAYLPGRDPRAFGIDPDIQPLALRLFDASGNGSPDDLRADYLRLDALHLSFPDPPAGASSSDSLPDLRDYITRQLAQATTGRAIDDFRGPRLPRRSARLRRRVMKAAAKRGYRTSDIARFFGVDPSTVSRAKYGPDRDPDAPVGGASIV